MQNKTKGMGLIVKTVTRLTVGLILIYGIYIVLEGHRGPGGGFAGGVIIALSFIHLMLAFGKEEVTRKINEARGVILSAAGIALFLLFFTAGLSSGKFPAISGAGNFRAITGGSIPLCDIAVSLMVGTGLYVLFLVLTLCISSRGRKV